MSDDLLELHRIVSEQPPTEYAELLRKYVDSKDSVQRAIKDMEAARTALRAVCKHKNTTVKRTYVDGDYLNKGYEIIDAVCNDCDLKESRTVYDRY